MLCRSKKLSLDKTQKAEDKQTDNKKNGTIFERGDVKFLKNVSMMKKKQHIINGYKVYYMLMGVYT